MDRPNSYGVPQLSLLADGYTLYESEPTRPSPSYNPSVASSNTQLVSTEESFYHGLAENILVTPELSTGQQIDLHCPLLTPSSDLHLSSTPDTNSLLGLDGCAFASSIPLERSPLWSSQPVFVMVLFVTSTIHLALNIPAATRLLLSCDNSIDLCFPHLTTKRRKRSCFLRPATHLIVFRCTSTAH